jgi:hypothetical protein
VPYRREEGRRREATLGFSRRGVWHGSVWWPMAGSVGAAVGFEEEDDGAGRWA